MNNRGGSFPVPFSMITAALRCVLSRRISHRFLLETISPSCSLAFEGYFTFVESPIRWETERSDTRPRLISSFTVGARL